MIGINLEWDIKRLGKCDMQKKKTYLVEHPTVTQLCEIRLIPLSLKDKGK